MRNLLECNHEWLRGFDIILINTSAGKDSLAMLDSIVELAMTAGASQPDHLVLCPPLYFEP